MHRTVASTIGLVASASAVVTLSPSATAGSSAVTVNKQFQGIAFEAWTLYNYTGGSGAANEFTNNLIHSFTDPVGVKALFRVGGSTGYVANDSQQSQRPLGQPNKYGPGYFKSYTKLPGSDFIFQVPFRTDSLDNIVDFFNAGYSNIGADNLYAIELGNEEDQTTAYNKPADYVARVADVSQAIIKGAKQSFPEPIFQVGDGLSIYGPGDYSPSKLLGAGVNANKTVKTWGMHYYQHENLDGGQDTLSDIYMNHTRTVDQLKSYVSNIQYLKANAPQIEYLLDEYGPGADPDFTLAIFGAALWDVDTKLYAMTQGVRAVCRVQIAGSPNDMWNTSSNGLIPNYVSAGYYSFPFVANFIGNATGSYRVADLTPPGQAKLTAYAAYDAGNLARVAIVNLNTWPAAPSDTANPGARGSQTFQLKVPSTTKSARVERLNADQGAFARADNTTWAGRQWSAASNGRASGARVGETAAISAGGTVSVEVASSQAVIVYLS